MTQAKKGDWVQIGRTVLAAGERAPQIPEETRRVPLERFFVGPGKTVRLPQELLTAVVFARPSAGLNRSRNCSAFAMAGRPEYQRTPRSPPTSARIATAGKLYRSNLCLRAARRETVTKSANRDGRSSALIRTASSSAS